MRGAARRGAFAFSFAFRFAAAAALLAVAPAAIAQTWGPETNVSNSAADTETGLGHRALLYDAQGTLHAVWAEADSPRSQYRVYTATFAAGQWATPTLLVDYPAAFPGDPGDELGAKYPGLAETPDGTLHVFWHDYRVGGIANAEIFTKTRAAGTNWDPAATADVRLTTSQHPETNGDNGLVPVPAVAPNGDLHVAWFDFRFDGSNAEILTKARPAGGAFDLTPGDAADERLTNDSANSELVDVAIDGAGRVHVVWRSTGGGGTILWTSRDPSSGAWGAPAAVATQATAAGAPTAAIDADDRLHVIWPDNRDGGRALFTRTRSAGGAWSAESRISRPADGADEPSLARTEDGTLHLAWSDGRVSLLNREIFHRAKTVGAAWDSSYAADTRLSNANGTSSRPSVAARFGRVAVSWKDSRDGQNEFYVRQFLPAATSVPRLGADATVTVFPNPTRAGVTIHSDDAGASLWTILDVRGRRIATVLARDGSAAWDGRDVSGQRVAPGVYFARDPRRRTSRITVLR